MLRWSSPRGAGLLESWLLVYILLGVQCALKTPRGIAMKSLSFFDPKPNDVSVGEQKIHTITKLMYLPELKEQCLYCIAVCHFKVTVSYEYNLYFKMNAWC
jgi:hypothetical protein